MALQGIAEIFSVLQRGGSGLLPEFPQEISKVIKPAVQTYVHDGKIRILKQSDGLADPVFIDICDRCFADDFFEKPAEVLFIHTGLFCKLMDVKFFLIILPDIGQGFFDDFDPVIICLFLCGQ